MPNVPPSKTRPQGPRKGKLLRAQAEPNELKKLVQSDSEVSRIARAKTKMVMERLTDIVLNSKNEANVISVCSLLLNRGWGKPGTQVQEDNNVPERMIQIAFVENKTVLPPSPITIEPDEDEQDGFSDEE
jgi:hypothetical protein